MDISNDGNVLLWQFIGQTLAIILSIVLPIIGGIKFLEKHQQRKVEVAVKEIVNPIVEDLRLELNNVKHCLEKFQEISKITLENVQDSIDRLDYNNRRKPSKRYDHAASD